MSTNTHERVEGDGAGGLRYTLAHNGTVQNLSGASVATQLRHRDTGALVEGTANIITAAAGLVEIDEDDLKTLDAGTWDVRFIVTYASGGTPDIFPSTVNPLIAAPPVIVVAPAWVP